MGWIIDRDYLDAGTEYCNVGRGSVKPLDRDRPTFRFRLRDDDGEVYYGGAFDMEHDDDTDFESSPYGCFSWGMADSGTTSFEVRAEDAEQTGLYPGAVEQFGAGKWVSIYG